METRKRKPLSDIANTYNLIPTSTLRKLVASSNSSEKCPASLKPNSSSKNKKFCSDLSHRSDTSIGSSNFSATRNSPTVQFPTPPRANSSFTSRGGMGSKDAAYSQRQTIEKSKKETDAAAAIVSPTPVEKRKDKGRAIAAPFSSSPLEKLKDNQNEICNPCSPLGGKMQKDEANISLFGGPAEIVKESSEGLVTYSCSYRKRDKGKAILNSSGCAIGKQKERENGTPDDSSCLFEKTNDGKKVNFMPSGSCIMKAKEMRKESVDPSSFLVERTKEEGKPLNSFSSSHEKTWEKEETILQTSDVVEITKQNGSSAAVAVNCRPPRRKVQKRKDDAGASSCPPVMRTKNIQNDLDESGDIKSSKSWTDPHPKRKMKRRSRMESSSELLRDFIEQQRAYFKEIDEDELIVEEVSEDELD